MEPPLGGEGLDQQEAASSLVVSVGVLAVWGLSLESQTSITACAPAR
ncbi:hypothetical protein AB0O34_33965 [Sphaerisporangium sp. NPDC088356]